MASKGSYASETKASVPAPPKILRAIIIIAGIAAIAVILWMLGEKEQRTPAATNAKPAPVSASSAYPVCPGPEVYRFPDKVSQITVVARTDCWSGWVITPAGSSYRIDRDSGAIAYLFVNGDFFRREKDEVSYFGVLRGIFRVKSEEPFSQEITVTITR